jgi:hypothetical protein
MGLSVRGKRNGHRIVQDVFQPAVWKRTTPAVSAPYPAAVLARPSPDEIRLCSGCGKPIITRRRTAEGEIVSEYCYQTGRYWGCAHARP